MKPCEDCLRVSTTYRAYAPYHWFFCPECGHVHQTKEKDPKVPCKMCPTVKKIKPPTRNTSADAKPPKNYKGQE